MPTTATSSSMTLVRLWRERVGHCFAIQIMSSVAATTPSMDDGYYQIDQKLQV